MVTFDDISADAIRATIASMIVSKKHCRSAATTKVFKSMAPADIFGILDFSTRILMPWAGIAFVREAVRDCKDAKLLVELASRSAMFDGTDEEAEWQEIMERVSLLLALVLEEAAALPEFLHVGMDMLERVVVHIECEKWSEETVLVLPCGGAAIGHLKSQVNSQGYYMNIKEGENQQGMHKPLGAFINMDAAVTRPFTRLRLTSLLLLTLFEHNMTATTANNSTATAVNNNAATPANNNAATANNIPATTANIAATTANNNAGPPANSTHPSSSKLRILLSPVSPNVFDDALGWGWPKFFSAGDEESFLKGETRHFTFTTRLSQLHRQCLFLVNSYQRTLDRASTTPVSDDTPPQPRYTLLGAWRHFRDKGHVKLADLLRDCVCRSFELLLKHEPAFFRELSCSEFESLIAARKVISVDKEMDVLKTVIDWAKHKKSSGKNTGSLAVGDEVRVKQECTYYEEWCGADCVVIEVLSEGSKVKVQRCGADTSSSVYTQTLEVACDELYDVVSTGMMRLLVHVRSGLVPEYKQLDSKLSSEDLEFASGFECFQFIRTHVWGRSA
jgi:hypothetical protein